ncbi:hypothetical protein [Mesorhizobium onobrychidis]|uniref:Uncharacterized protein n=1 Tax=Mesorhizobium onobrychidis TaxID=2775404 RepID=A0ABY5QU49_9HYPH|nr:hypothetical protein [Mesorhizobium onobrychidis]UVC14710.1 hypothetical protein IHQ72_29525 [Mesorhizobium onobrychidis]
MAELLGQDLIAPALETDPAATPAAPAPAPQPAVIVSDDLDDLELQNAKAAAQAEEAKPAAPAEPGIETPAAAATPGAPEKPKDQQEQQPAAPMIPKARFDEVNNKNDELARQNAFLAGQVEALKVRGPAAPAPAATPPAPATPPAADRLIAVGTQIDALAKKYDAGEISYAELKTQERALTNQEQAIREEILLAKVPQQQAQQPTATTDLYLDQLTAELEAKHPYLAAIESDSDFDYLVMKAKESFAAERVELPKGPIGSLRLRERVALLSDKYGPMLTGKTLAVPGATPAAPAPATPAAPGLSPDAAARAAKIAMQGNMPPNVASMTGSAGEVISEASIENMSDDDLAALPIATRHRFLGITT